MHYLYLSAANVFLRRLILSLVTFVCSMDVEASFRFVAKLINFHYQMR